MLVQNKNFPQIFWNYSAIDEHVDDVIAKGEVKG